MSPEDTIATILIYAVIFILGYMTGIAHDPHNEASAQQALERAKAKAVLQKAKEECRAKLRSIYKKVQ